MVGINFIINVLIQVLCIFIFLTIFFFTYASKIEGEVVENQVTFLLDDVVGIHLDSFPESVKKVMLNQLNSIEVNTPENIEMGKKIDESNNAIKSKTTKILIGLSVAVIIFVITSYVLSKKGVNYFKNLDLSKILKETAVIITAVGLTEFVFLTYIGSKYTSIDPYEIKAHLFGNLKNSLP